MRTRFAIAGLLTFFVMLAAQVASDVSADDVPKKAKPAAKKDILRPLNEQGTVLLDVVGKRVLLKTTVVQRDVTLEFFCCLKKGLVPKEHESILSLDAKAFVVHAALLALGAKTGTPARYADEKFHPPTGQRIDIFLQWKDAKGKRHRVAAQKWVRHSISRFFIAKMARLPADLKIPDDSPLEFDKQDKELLWFGPMTAAQKKKFLGFSKNKAYRAAIESFYLKSQSREMTSHWVFAGSRFIVDPETGKRHYMAEGGEFICMANFSESMLDVSIPSSDSDATFTL